MENRVDEFILEVDEDLKWERIEKLVREYGLYVAGVIFSIILAASSVVYWNHSTKKANEISSELFIKALGVDASESAVEAFKAVEGRNDSYAMLAKFHRAHLLIADDETRDEGLGLYREMMTGKGIDRRYRYLALIYFVQETLDTEDPEELMNLLQEASVVSNMWPHTTAELTALVAIRMEDTEQAISILEELINSNAPRSLVQRANALLETIQQGTPDA